MSNTVDGTVTNTPPDTGGTTVEVITEPTRLNPDVPDELDRKVREKIRALGSHPTRVYVRTARVEVGGKQTETNARIPYLDYSHAVVVGASEPCTHISEVRFEGVSGVQARLEWRGERQAAQAAQAGGGGEIGAVIAQVGQLAAAVSALAARLDAPRADPGATEDAILDRIGKYQRLFTAPAVNTDPAAVINAQAATMQAMMGLVEKFGGTMGGGGGGVAAELIKHGPQLVGAIGEQIKAAMVASAMARGTPEVPEQPHPRIVAEQGTQSGAAHAPHPATAASVPARAPSGIDALGVPPEHREGLARLVELLAQACRARSFDAMGYASVLFDALDEAEQLEQVLSISAADFAAFVSNLDARLQSAEAKKRLSEIHHQIRQIQISEDNPDDGQPLRITPDATTQGGAA